MIWILSCKENVEGRKCDACVAGAYSYPDCLKCPCAEKGTEQEICDQVFDEKDESMIV